MPPQSGRLTGILWAPRNLVATIGPEGLVWIPFQHFVTRAKTMQTRLAYFSGDDAVRTFPAHATEEEIQKAFGQSDLVAVERLPAHLQTFALNEVVVEQLHQTIPTLEVLTLYAAVLRNAIVDVRETADVRPTVRVLAHSTADQPWIFAFRGPLVAQVRPSELDMLLVDVRQTLGAMEFDPKTDRILATATEREALALLGEVERFDFSALLTWFADAPVETLPRFAPAKSRERERLALNASRRRFILGAGVGAVGLLLTAGGWTWLERMRAEWLRQDVANERRELDTAIQDLRIRNYGALLRRREPDWADVLLALSRAWPDGLQLETFTVTSLKGQRWEVRATGVTTDDEGTSGMQFATELRARLQGDPVWRKTSVTPAFVKSRVGVIITLTV